jgi:hypothetical protein
MEDSYFYNLLKAHGNGFLYDSYGAILFIRYDPEENVFYDECGFRIRNIFEMITPNDLVLYRANHDYCCFPCRYSRNILCWIGADDD